MIFDWFASFPDVDHYALEAITVPVLIAHAADDPVASFDAAQRAAGRIPGARLLRVNQGGHLMLGRKKPSGPGSPPSWRRQDRRDPPGAGVGTGSD